MDVLIVENNLVIQKAIEFRLRKDGFNTHTVDNGKSAIEMIDVLKPRLVITDLMTPFLTGMELLHYIKKNTPEIPVIILSAAGKEQNVKEAYKQGVDDFITKPFSPFELSLRAKRLMGL